VLLVGVVLRSHSDEISTKYDFWVNFFKSMSGIFEGEGLLHMQYGLRCSVRLYMYYSVLQACPVLSTALRRYRVISLVSGSTLPPMT